MVSFEHSLSISEINKSPVNIRPLGESRADLNRFWDVMTGLSGNEASCVLPLRGEVRAVLGDENPYWTHARRKLWIAERNGRPVGRIAGIIDEVHQKVHGDRTAFFGFLECVDDPGVAAMLFETVVEWSRHSGCDRLRGPMNPTINEECGLMVSGFERRNSVMMPHSPPHLPACVEACGFTGVKDLLVFEIKLSDGPMERLKRFQRAAAARAPDIRLASVTRSNLAHHLDGLKEIYNEAWERNWGAVPMSSAEIDFLARRLKPLLLDGLVWMAESGGKPLGLLLAIPDVNEVLGPLRGRLIGWPLVRALPVLAGWRRPSRFRLVALGVKAAHRRRGIEGMLFAETLAAGMQLGFESCEASWILEDNRAVRQLVEVFQGRLVQRYRIYERPI